MVMRVPTKTRHKKSDHCDGERFFNPDGRAAKSFSDLPKWWLQQLFGTRRRWPSTLPAARTPGLPDKVGEAQIAATFIGHATCLVQLPGFTLLTDPVFSERAGPFGIFGPKRVQPPALRREHLPPIDAVLLSHSHYDHCDLATLRWLSKHRRPRVFAPLGLQDWLARRKVANVVELDWWQMFRTEQNVDVICTPAQHWSSRTAWDRCETLWGGWWVKAGARSVYFAGDTAWGGHFAEVRQRIGAPELALLPIGAYEPRWFMESVHMNPDEAVQAHLTLGARRSLGIHHRTFRLTDEGIDDPTRELDAARRRHGVAPADFPALTVGEGILAKFGR
jgi:L-ascorbate metabolism protein UlaG (beta-lactamase superfamily)